MEHTTARWSSKNDQTIFPIALIVILALSLRTHSQIVYSGTLGKAAVEFVIEDVFLDTQRFEGVYMYKKYHEPISLTGVYTKSSKKLILHESDQMAITFEDYSPKKAIINGVWRNGKTGAQYTVQLNRLYSCTRYDTTEPYVPHEILQCGSGKRFFLKIKAAGSVYGEDAVLVYEKKTGELFQEIDINCGWGVRLFRTAGFEDEDGQTISIYLGSTSGPLREEWMNCKFSQTRNSFCCQDVEER
jgi:hypothetical protein